MPLFQIHQRRGQVLESLLIALSFTRPLEAKHIKSILQGFVYNERFYLGDQKKRGYFKKKYNLLALTDQAKYRVHSSLIEFITNKTGGDKKTAHEVALVHSLFLCLVHLNFADIKQIKKQKQSDIYTPDLTIITKTDTLYIEVDTGSQAIKILETKIKGYQATHQQQGTLIYFTTSARTYSHFNQNPSVQFIYLQSKTLSEDIQKLTSNNLKMWATETSKLSYKDKHTDTLNVNTQKELETILLETQKLLDEDF